MECLRDYIGLLGCKPSNPGSGLFINSLPGISLQSLDMIADSEQITYVKVWKDIQTRALVNFATDVTEEFRTKYKLKTIRNSFSLGKIINASSVTNASAQFRGFVYQTNLTALPGIVQSNLQAISFQSLSIYLTTVPYGPFNVFIWDLETGEKLFEQEINNEDFPLEEGWNEIPVNKIFQSNKIFACYDASQIDSVELDISRFNTLQWRNYFSACYQSIYGCNSCTASLKGATTADINEPVDPEAISYSPNNVFGLSAVFSITCSYDPLVCANKKSFAAPLWYLLGVETCVERLSSSRMNWWTLDDEEVGRLLDYFTQKYKEKLTSVVSGIDLDLKDACLECHERITYQEGTP